MLHFFSKIKIPYVIVLSHVRLCNPLDYSPLGFSVHGIFQARILGWVAISLSREIFLTQGSNLQLLHWQADALPAAPPGKPCLSVQYLTTFFL